MKVLSRRIDRPLIALAIVAMVRLAPVLAQNDASPSPAPPPPLDKPAIARPATEASGGDATTPDGQAENALENGLPPELAKLFPVGRPFGGVRIPSYSGDVLNSVITAEVMTRADEEHLDMEQLVITVFTRNQPDTRILMDKAVYDMTEAKLLGRTPATIEQEGFEMRGDRMTFDSHSQTGHMVGNVKMTIFDVNQFASGGMLGAPTGTP